jgi:hypothetical protein
MRRRDFVTAHEYRPTPGRDPIQSLTQALEIMDA